MSSLSAIQSSSWLLMSPTRRTKCPVWKRQLRSIMLKTRTWRQLLLIFKDTAGGCHSNYTVWRRRAVRRSSNGYQHLSDVSSKYLWQTEGCYWHLLELRGREGPVYSHCSNRSKQKCKLHWTEKKKLKIYLLTQSNITGTQLEWNLPWLTTHNALKQAIQFTALSV